MIEIDSVKDALKMVPFMLSAGATQPKFSIQRVLEALIIAAITAMATSYLTVQRLEGRQSELQRQFDDEVKRRDLEVSSVKSEVKENRVARDQQYENIRTEIQRLALSMERRK